MNPHPSNPAVLAPSGFPQIPSEAGSKGNPLENPGEEGFTEEFNYDPVPAKKTLTISVRYHIGGRGQPLPYPLDEGDGE